MESERQAWVLCQNQWSNYLTMTALCPSFVFGPLMDITASSSSSVSSSYSITLVDQWIRGVSPVQSRLFVDVRDVARAHVIAANNNAAIGQRIIVSIKFRVKRLLNGSKMRYIDTIYPLTLLIQTRYIMMRHFKVGPYQLGPRRWMPQMRCNVYWESRCVPSKIQLWIWPEYYCPRPNQNDDRKIQQ